ncbi:MAG: DUF1127 domain-containing protein [Alphaproteobacteria bacterium]|nr:DUF1127 domain-containing protein [Alphaproteobacteria bacterium]
MTRMLLPAATAPATLLGRTFGCKRPTSRVLDLLLTWQERAIQRRALAQMDDRALADIGVARCAALSEAAKPFWRA